MLLWDGACIVHEEFKGAELEALRREHPRRQGAGAPGIAASVIAQADVVGSTSRMVQAVRDMDADEFIVATDRGIFHKMRQLAPGKRLIEAPTAGKSATCRSCAHCPWMAMNSLTALLHCARDAPARYT